MTTVTADDIRVLARSDEDQPVLIVVDNRVAVVPAEQADASTIVYTRADLVDEYGDQLTEIDADLLASSLTARLKGEKPPL
jgi:riboflavin biosynthesis pyrimidine reductase